MRDIELTTYLKDHISLLVNLHKIIYQKIKLMVKKRKISKDGNLGKQIK